MNCSRKKNVKAEPQQVQELPKKDTVDSLQETESSASDGVAATEQPKDSLFKRAARVAKVKSEMGMIRALYGVVEEDMGRAVALYGVRPPREIIMPDGLHKVKPRSWSSERFGSSSSDSLSSVK